MRRDPRKDVRAAVDGLEPPEDFDVEEWRRELLARWPDLAECE